MKNKIHLITIIIITQVCGLRQSFLWGRTAELLDTGGQEQ